MTLTMLHAIRDSNSRREAPNTTPVVFTSRQYTRSTTARGGRGEVSVHNPAKRRAWAPRHTLAWESDYSMVRYIWSLHWRYEKKKVCFSFSLTDFVETTSGRKRSSCLAESPADNVTTLGLYLADQTMWAGSRSTLELRTETVTKCEVWILLFPFSVIRRKSGHII